MLPVDEDEQVNSSGRHLQSGFDAIFMPPPLLSVWVVAVLAPAGDNVVVAVVVVAASRVWFTFKRAVFRAGRDGSDGSIYIKWDRKRYARSLIYIFV